MRTFREIVKVMVESADIKKIESAFSKEKLEGFLDSLTFYIDYNDEQSKDEILSYIKELKKAGLITSPKAIYRLVRLEQKEVNKKPKKRKMTSSSTEKMEGKTLQLMKGMIDQYKKKGDYYYQEINDAEGFDVNDFAKVFHNNREYFLENYNRKIIRFFYDTIDNKAEQKEFLIFGDYSISNQEQI